MRFKFSSYFKIQLSFLIKIFYWLGMGGSLLASIYYIFFDNKSVGIGPSTIVAFLSALLIMISVILAQFIKNTKKTKQDNYTYLFLSLAIIFTLYILTYF